MCTTCPASPSFRLVASRLSPHSNRVSIAIAQKLSWDLPSRHLCLGGLRVFSVSVSSFSLSSSRALSDSCWSPALPSQSSQFRPPSRHIQCPPPQVSCPCIVHALVPWCILLVVPSSSQAHTAPVPPCHRYLDPSASLLSPARCPVLSYPSTTATCSPYFYCNRIALGSPCPWFPLFLRCAAYSAHSCRSSGTLLFICPFSFLPASKSPVYASLASPMFTFVCL